MRYLVAVLLFGCLGIVGSAQASLVIYQFSGVVESVWEPANDFSGKVHVGDPFVLTYVFDASSPDLSPDFPDYGLYCGPIARIELPDVTYEATSEVHVEPPGVLSFGTAWGVQPLIGAYFAGLQLPNDSLPSSVDGLGGHLYVKAANYGSGMFEGTIVPEPSSALFLFFGVVFCGRRPLPLRRS